MDESSLYKKLTFSQLKGSTNKKERKTKFKDAGTELTLNTIIPNEYVKQNYEMKSQLYIIL